MDAAIALRELLAAIVQTENIHAALSEIVSASIRITGSRNALLAILNDELGQLEIQHGEGPDWLLDRVGHKMEVGIGKRTGITALVAATHETFVTGNVAEVSEYQKLFESTVSEIAVPVRDRHGLLRAVLNLESDRPDEYSAHDVTIVEAIAEITALVLERDEVLNRERALLEVGSSIDRSLSEHELLDEVIDIAGEVMRLQACSIFLLDGATQQYVLRASTGALRDKVGRLAYEPDEGVTGWVCSSGESILLDHPNTDPRWRGKYTEFPSEEIASFIAVPIHIRGRSIGAIRAMRRLAENEYLDNKFTETDLRVLEAIGDQLGVALDSIRSVKKLLHSERMSAWGELSAKSAHMIGNRVFALKGDVNELGHLIKKKPLDLSALDEIRKSLDTNVLRLQELLQDFRDFVTATQISKTLGNLNELVVETVSEVFPKRTKIDLQFDLDRSLPEIEFDEAKLRLAISEIVENSMNFMGKGSFRVKTGIATHDLVAKARLGTTARYATVSLTDNGPGVETARKQLIFQPFYSSRVKGMGLGLSIVKGIADAHGGTVIEIGHEGEGANFVILLPISERPNTKP